MRLLTMLAALIITIPVYGHKPFIVCDLHGKFGNQLFQIAAAVTLAKEHNAIALFPQAKDRRENIQINYFTVYSSLNSSTPPRKISTYYKNRSLKYQPIPYTPDMRIDGYFQSENYFKHNRGQIVKLFAPSATIMKHLQTHYNDIITDPKAVSIHVRTYVKEVPAVRCKYVLNGRNYLQKAIALFPSDSHFIVFSDDINWCKKNISDLAQNMRFVEGENYFYDFFLQSMCQHNIISNSSFSWWAAWLNKNPNKIVVAPKEWFTSAADWEYGDDIVPKSWVQLDNQ